MIQEPGIDPAMIRLALDEAGYVHEPATVEALRECFLDYVDAGYWRDLTMDDTDDVPVKDMIRALRRP